MIGSTLSTVSPSTSVRSLSTPCVDGCWGPRLTRIDSSSTQKSLSSAPVSGVILTSLMRLLRASHIAVDGSRDSLPGGGTGRCFVTFGVHLVTLDGLRFPHTTRRRARPRHVRQAPAVTPQASGDAARRRPRLIGDDVLADVGGLD